MYGYIDCLWGQCLDFKLCTRCFWSWWFKKKRGISGRIDAFQEIGKFMKKYKLRKPKEKEESWQRRKRKKSFQKQNI